MSVENEESNAKESFETLGLDLRLLKAVRKLGLDVPTPIQASCIPLALQGKDVLARAPTGSGKTLAYSIPLLQKILRTHDAGSSSESPQIGGIILVPTRELCQQVHGVMRKLLGHAGAAGVRVVPLATPGDLSSVSSQTPPDVIVATPSRLRQLIDSKKEAALGLRESVHMLVVDEADLLLSYGYGDDIAAIGSALPSAVQTLLLSATISPDLDAIRALFLHNPVTIDVAEDGGAQGKGLRQFWLRCSHSDKFLVMYALFKLNRIPGRSLIFVNSVDRGFRLRLFLEQFGVSAGVLNCELPLASRWHAIQAFNRGIFDILIATDDPKLMASLRTGRDDAAAPPPEPDDAAKAGKKRKRRDGATGGAGATEADAEFGVARGVDFTDVTAVINMDLPTSLAVYRHRVGRTARAGKSGTAISLIQDSEANDEDLLAEMAETYGGQLNQFQVDMAKLAAFRYRTEDAMRAVTKNAVKEARLSEIKREMVNSKKLTAHFDANPDDLAMLRHDRPLATARKQAHLSHVPAYLKPETEGATETVAAIGSSARRMSKTKGRKLYGDKKSKKDPLRNFKGKPKKTRKSKR